MYTPLRPSGLADRQNTNFLRSPDGSKKAYARLTADVDALDIAATKLALV